jgi:hypothetical protein
LYNHGVLRCIYDLCIVLIKVFPQVLDLKLAGLLRVDGDYSLKLLNNKIHAPPVLVVFIKVQGNKAYLLVFVQKTCLPELLYLVGSIAILKKTHLEPLSAWQLSFSLYRVMKAFLIDKLGIFIHYLQNKGELPEV